MYDVEKTKQYWLNKRKTTPYKVIGWSAYDSFMEITEDNPEFDDYFAAAINDIAEHGYLFPGDRVYRLPIFNDHRTFAPLFAKTIGRLMALSRDIYDEYGYSLYTWYLRMEDDGIDDDIKYPEEGPYYEGKVTLKVENKIYREMYKHLVRFEDTKGEKPYKSCVYLLLVDEKVDPLWSSQNYIIAKENAVDTFEFYPSFIFPIRNIEQYDELRKLFLKDFAKQKYPPLLVDDYNYIKTKLSVGPGYILAFNSGEKIDNYHFGEDE